MITEFSFSVRAVTARMGDEKLIEAAFLLHQAEVALHAVANSHSEEIRVNKKDEALTALARSAEALGYKLTEG